MSTDKQMNNTSFKRKPTKQKQTKKTKQKPICLIDLYLSKIYSFYNADWTIINAWYMFAEIKVGNKNLARAISFLPHHHSLTVNFPWKQMKTLESPGFWDGCEHQACAQCWKLIAWPSCKAGSKWALRFSLHAHTAHRSSHNSSNPPILPSVLRASFKTMITSQSKNGGHSTLGRIRVAMGRKDWPPVSKLEIYRGRAS